MRARPSAWLSSPGGGWVVALARQCRQASRQAPVVSQNTSIGRWLKSTAGRVSAVGRIAAGAVIAALPLLGCAVPVTPAWAATRRGHRALGPRGRDHKAARRAAYQGRNSSSESRTTSAPAAGRVAALNDPVVTPTARA